MRPENNISDLGVWQEGRSSPLLSVMGVPMRVDQKGPEYLRNRVDVGLVRSSRRKKLHLLKSSYRGVGLPQLGERVELKVGWPTVKVPFVMVWGFECSFLSIFIMEVHGA